MKILIVCSGNAGYISPFILEQAESLQKKGVTIDYFLIIGKGVFGYLKNYPALIKKIKLFQPDLIHAHYGFSGMLAVLQKKIPVVTTFHGSDINESGTNFFISKIVEKKSIYNIFVNKSLVVKIKSKNKFEILSCGIDLDKIFPLNKEESRKKLGFDLSKKLILFSSSFDNKVKNYPLAKKAVDLLKEINFIEMKGYSREEVNLLMNACDVLLVTSKNESGPLVVKEAMVCGCPIVTTDVGDVKTVIGNTQGCYITTYDPFDIAEKLKMALAFNKKTNGKNRIIELKLDINIIADNIISIYNKILKQH